MPEPSVSTVPEDAVVEPVPAGVQTLTLEAAPEDACFVEVDEAATRKLGIMGWIAIAWLVMLVLGAFLVPLLPVASPNKPFLDHINEGPSLGHLFGTDGSGQDMFSRVLWGARHRCWWRRSPSCSG